MRIDFLTLQRYGHFTDFTLDFGERNANGKPDASSLDTTGGDFHLVYGGNEAGKTTAFNALLDLLFGIPRQSSYAFLHERKALCIAACLEHQNARYDWIRTGQGLSDKAGHTVNPATLAAVSAGLSRAAWVSMFSLDDDTLERGGDEILASQGDLGSLLFSASSGMTGLHQRLDELGAEHDDFYHPRKQKLEIRTLIDAIRDAGKSLRSLDDSIAQQKRLRTDLDQLEGSLNENAAETRELHQQQQLIESRLRAVDATHRYQRLRQALDPLSALPDTPDAWLDDGTELLDRVTRAESEQQFLESTLAETEARCELLPEPDPLLALAEDAGALLDDWRQCEILIGQQGEDDARRHALQSRQQALCNSLGIDSSETPPRWLRDTDELQRIRAAREAGQALPALEGIQPLPDTASLQRLLEQVRETADGSRLEELRDQRAQAASRLDALQRSLLPWQGDIDALASLLLPDTEKLDHWQQRLRQLNDALAECRQRRQQADVALAASQQRLEAMRTEADWIDPGEQGALRDHADGLWQAHAAVVREHLAGKHVDAELTASLAAFEQTWRTLVLTDTLTQSQISAWGSYRAELSQQESYQRSCDQARQDDASLSAELDALNQEIGAVAASIGRPPEADLPALTRFTEARATALETVEQRNSLDARIAALLTKRQQYAERLQALAQPFSQLDTPIDGEHLEELMREVADLLASHQQRQFRVHQSIDELSATASELRHLEEGRQRIDALHQQCRERLLAMQHRIGDIEGTSLAQQFSLLEQRLATAREQAAERQREIAQRDEQRKALEALQRETDVLLRDYRERNQRLGTADAPSQRLALERLRDRRRLRNDLADAANALCDALQVSTVEEGLALMQAHDKDTLLADQARTQAALRGTQSQREALLETRQKLRHDLARIGSDDAAARLQERIANLKLELQERSEAALRQRLGVAAVREALRQYQETHRSSMMQAASDAFQRLSGGHFSHLDIQSGIKGEALYAIKSNRQSIQAGQMSKGTRFQLYLALRIAGYREFANAGDPPPFIADDIMETFDDARAELALRELAELSRTGQVVYLTHHRHIVDLARKTLGDAIKIHELPRPPHAPDLPLHSADT